MLQAWKVQNSVTRNFWNRLSAHQRHSKKRHGRTSAPLLAHSKDSRGNSNTLETCFKDFEKVLAVLEMLNSLLLRCTANIRTAGSRLEVARSWILYPQFYEDTLTNLPFQRARFHSDTAYPSLCNSRYLEPRFQRTSTPAMPLCHLKLIHLLLTIPQLLQNTT